MSRIKRLAKIWCLWNAKMIESDDAMLEIGKLFTKECRPMWESRAWIPETYGDIKNASK